MINPPPASVDIGTEWNLKSPGVHPARLFSELI